jgi:hypothetical protein
MKLAVVLILSAVMMFAAAGCDSGEPSVDTAPVTATTTVVTTAATTVEDTGEDDSTPEPPEPVIMPDFSDRLYSMQEVMDELEESGLVVRIAKTADDEIPINFFVRASAAAGEEVAKGDTVTIWISVGEVETDTDDTY